MNERIKKIICVRDLFNVSHFNHTSLCQPKIIVPYRFVDTKFSSKQDDYIYFELKLYALRLIDFLYKSQQLIRVRVIATYIGLFAG